LLGAVPFGLVIAKLVKGVDVRDTGSGNIGATNVARSVGKGLGIVTLLLDALKGAAPVLLAQLLAQPLEIVALSGVLSIVGHMFPVYLKFRGGKGVATSLGVFMALTPIPTLIAAGAFLATFALARVVSVGSLVASLALVGAVVGIDKRIEVIVATSVVVLLVIVRHKDNIKRLIAKTELGV